MMSFLVASAVTLAMMQASLAAPRSAFSACLKQASEQAKSESVDAEAFSKYVADKCAAQATSFKQAVISFDLKNGATRAAAIEGAQLQIDDYLLGATDNYRLRTKPVHAATKPQ